MRIVPVSNINQQQIAVTGTATALYTLVDTAMVAAGQSGGSEQYFNNRGVNMVYLTPTGGNIRYSFSGTPTASLGGLINAGVRFPLYGNMNLVKLIRTGGSNVTVDLEFAEASAGEGQQAALTAATITVDSEFPAAAALNGTWPKTTSSTVVGAAVMGNDGTNLVLIGGEATNGLDVDVTRIPAFTPNKAKQTTTITSSTAETTIVTAVSAKFNDIYGLKIANKSSTGTLVTIRDDTAGTPVDYIYVPASETRGYMLPSPDAFPQTAVNKNWTATCGTSVDSVYITVNYVSLSAH